MNTSIKIAVKKYDFPCVIANDAVVAIMTSDQKAVVIHRLMDSAIEIGSIMTGGEFNMNSFKLFDDTIEISN